ncbi:MAG TPA: TAXI family TRAP transporter solute-binding subunit [Telluria sp.]|nr:TAXI family TRAP transporter solute-binding subunit [Telluria sp.]
MDKTFQTRRQSLLQLAALLLAPALPVSAQDVDRAPIKLTTTGAAASGFFGVVIEALNAIYRDSYPGSTVTFVPNSVGGGMLAAAEGKADVVIALPPVEIQRALAGQEPFHKSLKGKLLHAMTILEELDFGMIATRDWADKHGIRSFADLARVKPPVRLGASVRATFYINDAVDEVLRHYGTDLKTIDRWGGRVYYNASGTNMQDLRDGKLDMVVTAGLQPDRRLQEVASNVALVWIGVDKAVLEAAAAKLHLQVATMPKSHYGFLERDELTLRAPSFTAVGAHVPAQTVYKMLKAIDLNMERVRAIHPHFKNFSVQYMAKPNPGLPLHPGAERFYREKGML